MTPLDKFLKNTTEAKKKAPRVTHPKGWEPGVEQTATEAVITTHPTEEQDKSASKLLLDSNLDPAEWRIVEDSVQVRRWQQTPNGGWMHYYKFNAVRGTRTDTDLKEIINQIKRHRSTPPPADPNQTAPLTTRVVAFADWQAGKGEGGGSEALVNRLLACFVELKTLIKKERPDHLIIAGLGDLVEGCRGHYDMQEFQVDLDRRQQVKLVRRLILKFIQMAAPLVPRITVACVPGNHGENRRRGKAFTTFGDNDDVAVFEMLHDILKENPASYGHVRFAIPDNELVVTLDIPGTTQTLALAHGHQFGRGSGPQNKAMEWWKGQALGRQGAGEADILLTGHYHHLQYVEQSPRTWIQAPAMDGGSAWWRSVTGQGTEDSFGMLTFTIGERGVDNLKVLRPNI